ncbi:SapC family protein [Massilia forsythiae]|uniref:SapC family protein n=1 Tax=Massilia forsythiae TaxID=2728020 RepID=A0A7Z2ZUD4_9BURK|nr:SapC family protein [Massilia forsythiae]QJE02185.1 SapC family protein [Massilia forsythiae]
MPNHVLLNSVDHKDLRVITARGAAYGDAVMSALTFPAEFRELQASYPIVFARTADGMSFDPVALLGFEEGENLFLVEDHETGQARWDAPAIPLTVERQPFMIGRGAEELSVHVDLDSPRLSTAPGVGEALFLTYGGTSEYLERIASVLRTIHEGLTASRGFVAALMELELLESFALDIELDDGSQNRLAGFYTIHEERLLDLPAERLERLNRAGYLQAIYMAVASLSQFRGLIERRNRANRDRHAQRARAGFDAIRV